MTFEEVYREFYPRVYRFVLSRIGCKEEAEDLAQEVMVAAFKNYALYDPKRSSLATWIFVIARNRLKNYYRDRRIIESIDDQEGFDFPSGEELQDEAVVFQEQCDLIRRALGELEERDRIIVENFFLLNKTNVEIAEDLGITANNVGVAKKRALAKLRLILASLGYQH